MRKSLVFKVIYLSTTPPFGHPPPPTPPLSGESNLPGGGELKLLSCFDTPSIEIVMPIKIVCRREILLQHYAGSYFSLQIRICKVCSFLSMAYFFSTPGPQLLLPNPSTAASKLRIISERGFRLQSCVSLYKSCAV